MANIQKTVEIIFGGKNEVSNVIGSIERNFDSLNSSITAATKPLATIADSVFKLDAALLALAAGGLYYAYEKAIKFESAMVSFRKVSDGTQESMDAARASSFALSTQYGATAVSVLNSTTDFIQAGYDTQQSLKLTEEGLKLMMAGEVSVAEASQFMITILKGFKAPAEDASRLTDILNAVSDKTATNVRELAIGMAYLSPIAKLMGLSFEETAGLLTPVIEVFSSGSEAAHGLRTGLLRIVNDSAPVRQGLEQLGVSQTDLNGKLRSGKDILLDVQKAYVGLDDPTRIFLTQQLAGKDQAAKMLEVFNGLNKTLEVTNIAMGASGSIAKEVALRLESSQIQVDRFKVGFENLGIVVGEQFKVAATGAATGANAILQALNGLVVSGAFAPLFDELSKMGTRLSEYLVKIAAALPGAMKGIDFSGLIASFERVGGEIGKVFSTLFGDVDLTTAEGLHKAIQAVVDALGKLVDFTGGMIKGMAPLWEAISLGIEQFSEMDSEGVTLAGTIIGVGKAVNVLTENAGLLTGALYLLTTKALVETATSLASLGAKALSAVGGMGALAAAAGAAVQILGVGVAGAVGYAAGSLLNQIPVVGRVAQGFWELIDVNDNFFGASGRTKAQMDETNKKFEEAVAKHKTLAGSLGTTGAASDALTGKVDTLKDRIGALPKEVSTKFDINEAIRAAQEIAFLKKEIDEVPEKRDVIVSMSIEDFEAKIAGLDQSLANKHLDVAPQLWDEDSQSVIEHLGDWIRKTSEDDFGKTITLIPIGIDSVEVEKQIAAINKTDRDALILPAKIDWDPDGTTFEKIGKSIEGIWKQSFVDGEVLYTDFGVKIGESLEKGITKGAKGGVKASKAALSLEKAQLKLEEEKLKNVRSEVKYELKFDETKIKASADVIQKSIEWKAKVDIAEAEGAFKVLAEAAKNIGTEIDSTGKTMGGLVESLIKTKDWGKESTIEKLIKQENERRSAAFEANQELIEQTIRLNKERLKAYEKGEGMVMVKADGLKPHLELILWEILEAIQVRANESGSEFLLGMKAV